MSNSIEPPYRGEDRREGRRNLIPETSALDIPTFLERFSTATTDKEKLLLFATLLNAVGADYREDEEHKRCGEAIYHAFSELAAQLKVSDRV